MNNIRENVCLDAQFLKDWINRVNETLPKGYVTVDQNSKDNTLYQIKNVAKFIEDESPFYSEKLNSISNRLFMPSLNTNKESLINIAVFGELSIIIEHIMRESVNMGIWQEIHPRITKVSKKLFYDEHYASAAEKAFKELESRLRELFKELKPNDNIPNKVGDYISRLLSENGAYRFADLSTISGKDYRQGIEQLFRGVFAAYRNPAAHENLSYTKREAIEQIMLVSQLMYVLDK